MTYKNIASKSPYFDDFDESKNFHRLLFRPEKAVQARELTQIGSIAQNQISELANFTFEDGTSVVGGDVSVDFKKRYMEIQTTDNEGDSVDPNNFKNKDIQGQTSGAKAIITKVDSDNYIFYFDYHSGNFEEGEEIITYDGQYDASIETSNAFGRAIFAKLEPGVIFVNKHFVKINETQEIIVDGTGNQSHNLIGFTVNEEVVQSSDDVSLLDPANNATNYNAPGAHRYRINATLDSIDAGESPVPDNFYVLVEINNGNIIREQENLGNSELNDVLARRRYEESGNYVVDDFSIKLASNPSDDSKLQVGLEEGIAYVYGYRYETKSTVFLNTPKPRTYEKANNENLFVDIGPSVDVDSVFGGVFDISSNEIVSFYSSTNGGGSKIGEARIVSLVYSFDGQYRAHFIELDDISDLFSSVRSFVGNSTGATANVKLEENGLPELHDLNDKVYILETPNYALRNFVFNETNYDATRSYSGVTKETNDTYKLVSNDNKVTFYPSSQNGVILLVDGDTGNEITDYTAVTQNSDSELVITVNNSPLPSSIDVIVKIYKNEINPRTKTLTQSTDTKTTNSEGKIESLNNVDVYQLVSITKVSDSSSVDTDTVRLNTGGNDFYYDFGSIEGLESSTEYDIVYEYFEHSGDGDYFSVDSYDSSMYESIPTYVSSNNEEYNLRDCLDFRRSITEFSGGFDKVHMKTNVRADYNYYLPRVDKVYLDKNGNFGIKQGVPELEPNKPGRKENSMTLYELVIPAYLFNKNNVEINPVFARNYTMDEIGEIENRVKTLEYYSSLNQLEQDTKDRKIYDEEGFDKTKNGILVDNFVGHAVSQVKHPEYRCSIDRDNQELRSPFLRNNLDMFTLEDDSTLSENNIRNNAKTITLDFTTTPYISQLKASENMSVNPYNISNWSGTLELTPSTDNWTDTETAPDVTVNMGGNNNNWEQMEDAFGTQWNDWQTTWAGTPTEIGRSEPHTNENRRSGRDNQSIVTAQAQTQARTGTQLNIETETIRRNIGERIVDTSVIPFMRTRNVDFVASGMKPESEVKAYFDDTDVSSYCTPDGGSQGDPLITDDSGTLNGTFSVPNDSNLQFRTGTKTFRLADDSNNPSTQCQAQYSARGIIETRQNTIVSTEVPDISQETVTQNRRTTEVSTEWVDPLAETILITEEGGLFLNSIRLFFESKPIGNDSPLPVTARIVSTENGFPSQNEVPYSEVTLPVESVSTSSDSSVGTLFEFSDPVYLDQDTEYAIVVVSNSNKYRLWVAEKGAEDIQSGETINDQPYTGSFFKSQNSSTWTPIQSKDLKMEVNRCVFNTNSSGTYDVVNESIGNTIYSATTMMPNIDSLTHDNTDINWEYKFRDYNGGAFVAFNMKNNIDFDERREIEDISGQEKPLVFRANFSSNNENLSPVINKERSSVILVENDVIDEGNYYDAGTYVTRTVNLVNPSDNLRVFVDTKEPVGSEVELYFNTGDFSSRYIVVDEEESEMVNEVVNVFYYNDSTISPSNTMTLKSAATVTRSYIEDNVSPNEPRLQLKSIENVGDFDDPVNTTAEEIFVVLGESDMDDEIVDNYDSNTTYDKGDHVFYNSEIWRSLSDNNNGNTPSTSSIDWELVVSARVESQVNSLVEESWRSMVVESEPDPKIYKDREFVEYTFVPKESINEEFTTFTIKIQMKSPDYVNIPLVTNFRALAVY